MKQWEKDFELHAILAVVILGIPSVVLAIVSAVWFVWFLCSINS